MKKDTDDQYRAQHRPITMGIILWILSAIACVAVASDDVPQKIPTEWSNPFPVNTRLTTIGLVPESVVEYSFVEPLTQSLAVVVDECWSPSGKKLNSFVCQKQALTAALLFAWTAPSDQGNVSALGAREEPVAHQLKRSLGDSLIRLRRDGGGLRPEPDDAHLIARDHGSPSYEQIQYNGTLPHTFLLRNNVDAAVSRNEESHPMFVATDGRRHEIAHLQPLRAHRKREYDLTATRYDAGSGIKVQRASSAVATDQGVIDWLNSDGNDGADAVLDMLWHPLSKNGYLAFNLKDHSQGKDGKCILVAESEGFGREWEDNWNWCFGSHGSGC